jgi:hypothetical protein
MVDGARASEARGARNLLITTSIDEMAYPFP